MKNLFIFWDEPLDITGGGIHRCIITLMRNLPQRGFNVHYLYSLDYYNTFHWIDKSGKNNVLSLTELRDFLIDKNCDIILGQEAVFSSTFTQVVKKLGLNGVKFINQYHSSLLYFDKKLTWDYLKFEWITNTKLSSRFKILVRGMFYPLWKLHVRRVQNDIYKYNYNASDVSLLLSEYEKPIMGKICGDRMARKCVAIPNPLSWDEISGPEILKEKQKEVLIVSRIYNTEKRIDLALRVWKILEDKGITRDWILRIVGDGIHKNYLMNMSIAMKLHNVIWEKRTNPYSYYRKASIFLLTSVVEGWALTLTESMQMGVVPLAFDSYPAVKSILKDGYDGYLIPSKDVKTMAVRLGNLIQDKVKREQMALNGLKSCRRFAVDTVMDQWKDMLNQI